MLDRRFEGAAIYQMPTKWYLCVLILATFAIAAGCDRKELPSPSKDKFNVGLLTPGPVSDAGWNAAAFDGLQLIKHALRAQTAMVQTTSPTDFEDAMRDFASRGFNL